MLAGKIALAAGRLPVVPVVEVELVVEAEGAAAAC